MLMIAALGVVIPLNVGVGLLGNNQFAATFNLSTTITWFVVASIATCIIAKRCIRNIRRYGIFGFSRHNWWFECARLAVIIGLFAGISCPVAAFFFPFLDAVILALFLSAIISTALFVITATVGYTVAFAKGARLHGKAFQCVHFFYCTMVPLTFLFASVLCWPQKVLWPNGVLVICCGIVSAFLLACGMLSIVCRYTKWEATTAAN